VLYCLDYSLLGLPMCCIVLITHYWDYLYAVLS